MRLTLPALVLGLLVAQGAMAAGDGTAALGGGLGGALGNVVGQSMGGRKELRVFDGKLVVKIILDRIAADEENTEDDRCRQKQSQGD